MTSSQSVRPVITALENNRHIPTIAVFLVWIANVVTLWSHRSRSRKALRNLGDHGLRDIGISRQQAKKESLKRFWMP